MLKEKVLKILAENRGECLSGQSIAAACGVSRNAVWKAVNALQKEGVGIVSLKNKGYALSENALLESDITLPENTRFFLYNSVDSTNNEAKRLLAKGIKENAVIIANEQTAGRGRLGRDFYSPKDTGLYFSYLFHPNKSLSDTVFITTAAAVSVVRAIEKISTLKPEIKWVNDVYLGGRKICGILTEAISDFESGVAQSVIVGIGINVNTADFPESIEKTAASLNDKSITRPKIAQALADEIIKVAHDLSAPDILEDYRAHSLVLGKKITYIKNGETFTAIADSIGDKGELIVKTPTGDHQTLSSGEISVRL